jgi:hypothetical protein
MRAGDCLRQLVDSGGRYLNFFHKYGIQVNFWLNFGFLSGFLNNSSNLKKTQLNSL